MSALSLTAENFDTVLNSGRVLVDFWAGWCKPCTMIAPIIEELTVEYEGRVTVAKVDVENESALAARFNVMSIPTVVLFIDGVEVKRFVGVQPKETYAAELKVES